MKKVCFLLVAFFCVSSLGVYAQETIHVTIDGKDVPFADAVPFSDENNRTQIPLRAVSDMMGYGVSWNETEKSAYIFSVENSGRKLTSFCYAIGKDKVEKQVVYGSGFLVTDTLEAIESKITKADQPETLTMDTVPIVRNNRTYVPIRYVSELLGHDVSWDDKANTVVIRMK